MQIVTEVPLRGHPAFYYKLQAAGHIYNLWTAKGAEPCALASRYFDGSIDRLESYMDLPCPHFNGGSPVALQASDALLHRSQEADSNVSSSQPTVRHAEPQQSVSADVESDLHHQRFQAAARAAEPQQSVHADVKSDLQGQRPQAQPCKIPCMHMKNLSYGAFVTHFMEPNLPVMIQGLADDWQSGKDWVTPCGKVHMDFLAQHFGSAQVTISNTSRTRHGSTPRLDMTVAQFADWWALHKAGKAEDGCLLYLKDWHFAAEFPEYKAYSTPKYFREDWLNDYFDMRRNRQQHKAQPGQHQIGACTDRGLQTWAQTHDRHQAEAQTDSTQDAIGSAVEQVDAHGNAEFRTQRDICNSSMPQANKFEERHRQADSEIEQGSQQTQNEVVERLCRACQLTNAEQTAAANGDASSNAQDSSYAEAHGTAANDVECSDYRFVYLGCKGTFTPLHADVLRSYSWSTNVTGRKRWKLLPPEYTHLLYDRFGRELPPAFDLTPEEGADKFPNLKHAQPHVIECIQEAGETIFVPSGWHHTVLNEEDTLSINHNWLNGHNIHWAWALLQQEYKDAAATIEDCREGCSAEEFEGLVQRNMAANCSMDFAFMADFMTSIREQEQQALRQSDGNEVQHSTNIQRMNAILDELSKHQTQVIAGHV